MRQAHEARRARAEHRVWTSRWGLGRGARRLTTKADEAAFFSPPRLTRIWTSTSVRAAEMGLRSTLVTCLLALLAVSAAAEGEFARAEFRSCSG